MQDRMPSGTASPGVRQEEISERNRWLGVLGHELRTPLTSMRVLAEYLLSDVVSDTDKDPVFLQGIHDQILNMSATLENLLELARLDDRNARCAWSRFRLRDVAETAADAVRPLIDHARVTLQVEVTPDDLSMNGDAVGVGRLITNLLRNAQKHTIEGLVHLSICSELDAGQPAIAIVVSDTGEGIPTHLKPRVGTAFVSGDTGEDWKRARGAGLGLSICHGIVQAHGGFMFIASSHGQGTQVTVHLRSDLTAPVPVR
jgi:two-component system OmpR family sensor kinase